MIRGFLARHGIVRNAIREDLLQFGLPAIMVFAAGLVVSGRDGLDRLAKTLPNLLGRQRIPQTLSVQEIVGLALVVVGFAVMFVALGTLRRSYASTLVIRKDHRLVTHGVYRFTRHPIYLGVLLVALGIPVHASSLYGFLIMTALIPVFLNRIRIEERLLTEEFGDDYRFHRKSTSKLIPFLY